MRYSVYRAHSPSAVTSKTWSRSTLPSPTLQWARAHPHLHFHFEHHEASSGRTRQTKPTLSSLTRSNRRHGQYVESCCALELDGILISPQSQRTRLSTTRARRLTRTGTQTSSHDRTPRPNHRRIIEQHPEKRGRAMQEGAGG